MKSITEYREKGNKVAGIETEREEERGTNEWETLLIFNLSLHVSPYNDLHLHTYLSLTNRRAGSMVEQEMRPLKVPSKKKAPNFNQ